MVYLLVLSTVLYFVRVTSITDACISYRVMFIRPSVCHRQVLCQDVYMHAVVLTQYLQWRLSPLGAVAQFPPPIRIPHAFLPPLPSVMPYLFLSLSSPSLCPCPFPFVAPSPVESGHVDTTPEKFS